jgi:hypothetical protein
MPKETTMPLPNSLPWMESVDAKMIRAHEHLETLEREIKEYLSTIKVEIVLKTDPALPNPWLVTWANDYIPPIRLSVLLGDCVHNMRSALDNLVCGLAKTVDPGCECRGGFPYRKDEADWNKNFKKDLKGVPPAAQQIIKSLQPWNDVSKQSPLLMLNKLSNGDKHRTCNFTLAYGHDLRFRVHGNDGSIIDIPYKKPLYLGEPHTVPLPMLSAAAVIPSARVEAAGRLVITLRDDGISPVDTPVEHVLRRCFDHVEKEIIGKLTGFLSRR